VRAIGGGAERLEVKTLKTGSENSDSNRHGVGEEEESWRKGFWEMEEGKGVGEGLLGFNFQLREARPMRRVLEGPNRF
jgi:hypothetical protein